MSKRNDNVNWNYLEQIESEFLDQNWMELRDQSDKLEQGFSLLKW